MDYDLIFIIGIVMLAFVLPSVVSAYADRRWPKMAIIMLILGAGSIAYAMQENPGAYSLSTIDDVAVDVLGRYLN